MNKPTPSLQHKQCIYCGKEKPETLFSLEHIIPEAMGGNLCPDLFKTREVCRSCNSTTGIFVDGPLIKSWFSKNAQTTNFFDSIDLEDPSFWIPFSYMGINRNIDLQTDDVCEMWIGPFGEHVYHIHQADDPRYDGYAGGNPINRKSDPGRAYLFLTSSEHKESFVSMRSFERQFRKIKRYGGNFSFETPIIDALPVDPLPLELNSELETICKYASSGITAEMQLTFQIGFEDRFLAKLARAIGYKLFGGDYLDSPYGKAMQDALWEKGIIARRKLLQGVTFFSESSKNIRDIAGFRGAYSIVLWALNERFVLLLTLPDGHPLSVVISDDIRLWESEEFDAYRAGQLYLIAPQVASCTGPIPFPDFLAHRSGESLSPLIESIEKQRKNKNP